MWLGDPWVSGEQGGERACGDAMEPQEVVLSGWGGGRGVRGMEVRLQ